MKTVVNFPERSEIAEEAAGWIVRLDADHPPTDEELAALGEWLARSPVHREELQRLAELWGKMNVMTELAVPVARDGPGGPRFRAGGQYFRLVRNLKSAVLATLAGVLMIVGAAKFFGEDVAVLIESGVYETGVGEQSTVSLSDGSRVVLNTDTRINVDYSSRSRNVYLSEGEALFTVAEIADVPFRVYAGSGRIEALGTAFAVRLDDSFIKVTVTDGQVSLSSATGHQGGTGDDAIPETETKSGSSESLSHGMAGDSFQTIGLIGAGEIARIYAVGKPSAAAGPAIPVVESLTEDELVREVAWSKGVLMFSGDTLGDVVTELSRYTSITIEIPEEELRQMRVGGRFQIGETEAMLTALEANFELNIQRLDQDRVILSSASE